MNKSLLTLYLIIFSCYIVATRQPDYFDGEKYPATIHKVIVQGTNKIVPKAYFSIGKNTYSINAQYVLLDYNEGDKVIILVEQEHPEQAAVYRFWGYWITWEELLASLIIAVLLFQVAVTITNNPSEDALAEQLSYKEEKKTKYV